MKRSTKVPWPHAPMHQLSESGTYLVTAGTYRKEDFFSGADRLRVLHDGLLMIADEFGWQLEAWAVFSNHYHFVGASSQASGGAANLSRMLARLHERTARCVNELDNAPGRKIWHNYWETRLTYQKSYLARLNYVHQNAVKHELVRVANQYPWCSAAWFERTAKAARVKTVYGFKTDKLRVIDEYRVNEEW